MTTVRLPEVPGRALGRHIEHDERSRAYALPEPSAVRRLRGRGRSVYWERRAPIWDQGDVAMCTGMAMAGIIATDSAGRGGDARVTDTTAFQLYTVGTALDDIAGDWPDVDTGSTGLAVAKAAQVMGFIAGYRHAFTAAAAIAALDRGPLIVGLQWLSGLDEPDSAGVASYRGYPQGGHEVALIGRDTKARVVWFANSWGPSWGVGGYFALGYGDFAAALASGGDCTQPDLYLPYSEGIFL
ncbi:hypothetical protein GCM10022221_67810 [Actinocorallia aurea]